MPQHRLITLAANKNIADQPARTRPQNTTIFSVTRSKALLCRSRVSKESAVVRSSNMAGLTESYSVWLMPKGKQPFATPRAANLSTRLCWIAHWRWRPPLACCRRPGRPAAARDRPAGQPGRRCIHLCAPRHPVGRHRAASDRSVNSGKAAGWRAAGKLCPALLLAWPGRWCCQP
jgi:hypothetical protein